MDDMGMDRSSIDSNKMEQENLQIIYTAIEQAKKELETADTVRKRKKIERKIKALEFALTAWSAE